MQNDARQTGLGGSENPTSTHSTFQTPPYSSGAPTSPQYAVAPPTNGMGIAALVCSICGLSILGVIFGHIGMSQIKKSRGTEGGYGIALAGAIIGWVGCAFWVLSFLMILVLPLLFVGIFGEMFTYPDSTVLDTINSVNS